MIGKASWQSTVPGGRGWLHSVSPTSNAIANSKPLGEGVNRIEVLTVSIDCLGTALDNLALAAANDTTVLQQLTAANLALTTSNATLTAANKKLSEALAKLPASSHALPVLLVHLECPTNPFLGTTVGLMAIVSASFT